MRKTIEVELVKRKANAYLRLSKPYGDETDEDIQHHRRGVISLLEVILHESGNYKGYGYQDGHSPRDNNPDKDDTRRIYY